MMIRPHSQTFHALRGSGMAVAFLLFVFPGTFPVSHAAGPSTPTPTAGTDSCTPLPVSIPEGSEALTREERLARLENAFNDSLARFAKCQSQDERSAQTAAGGQGGASAGSGQGGGSGGPPGGPPPTAAGGAPPQPGSPPPGNGQGADETPILSVAARDIRGAGDTTGSGRGTDATSPPTTTASGGGSAQTAAEAPGGAPGAPSSSEETPDDIPSGDNDSVLENQIRRAAMAETDPKRKAELWNEYRRYKGLPTKPVPATGQQ